MSDGNKKTMILTIFWSIIVDSIDVFDCAYKVWFSCMLHDVTVDIFLEKESILELFGYCKGGTS